MESNKIILIYLILFVSCTNNKKVSLENYEKLHNEIVAKRDFNNIDSFIIKTSLLIQNFSYDTIFSGNVSSNHKISEKHTVGQFYFCNTCIENDRLDTKIEDKMAKTDKLLYNKFPEDFCYRRKMFLETKIQYNYTCQPYSSGNIISVKERILKEPFRNNYSKMWLINIRTNIDKNSFIASEFMVFKQENEILDLSCENRKLYD